MPKYNDFELDLTTTKLNEENMASASMEVTDISKHNSCAGHCGTSVITVAIKCVPHPTRTEV